MAAIPSGYVDTGIVVEHTGSCTLKVRAVGYDVPMGLAGHSAGLTPSGGGIACGDWGSAATVTLYVLDSFFAPVNIAEVAGACPQPQIEATLSWTWTGLRLIAGLDTTAGARNLQYKLFSDSGSSLAVTITGNLGSHTRTVSGPALGSALVGADVGLGFSTSPVHGMSGFVGAAVPISDGLTLEDIVWNGHADPTTSDTLAFEGTSSGSGGTAHTFVSEAPLDYAVDVRVEDAAGLAPAHDVRVQNVAAQGVTVTNPSAATALLWRVSGTDRFWFSADLSGSWASAGIAPVVTDVPLRQIVPKRPAGGPESWAPVTLAIASPVDVLLSANVWSKTGSIALSGTGNSTWTVTGAGTVARALAATYPSADGYTTTKHAAGQDVWGWGLYSYLDLSITANASATLTVTITYNTNPATGATTTESYDISVSSGTATYRLDLPFPSGGGPTYYERATNLSISGFANGTYTLNACQLVAEEEAYVKVAQAGGVAGQWAGLTLSCDGSFPAYWWGENPAFSGAITRKEMECAQFGGSQQTLGGCVRMDGTLAALVTELNRMEGVTATLTTSVIAADLSDGTNTFGNLTSADYLASWLHPAMTLRVAPNATLYLYASMRFDQVILVPANTGQIVLPFRETIGMMLEALCVDGSGDRASAGFPMVARRSATGVPNPADAVIGGGATDASGFASVPIPVGTVAAANFYSYLEGV